MLPAILYIPLLGASYFIFDLFNTEKAEITDKTLQTTEFPNPNIPDATIRHGDGIEVNMENMEKSWGKIADYTAIDNIEQDEPDEEKEKYESQYSSDEVALLGELEQQKALAEEEAAAKAREEEALKELEHCPCRSTSQGQAQVSPILEDNPIQLVDTSNTVSNIVNGISMKIVGR